MLAAYSNAQSEIRNQYPDQLDEGFPVKVVDPHGLAVSGARIEIGMPGKTELVTLTTDPSGSAIIAVQTPLEIRVGAMGFEPLTQKVDVFPEETITLELRPAIIRNTIEVIVRGDSLDPETSVGSALEIDRMGSRTVFDSIESLVPGSFVTRRGVMGYGIAGSGTGVVTIRGVGGQPNTGVLVVVDGRPDFMGLMGHPLPDFYSLSDAQSVSITQGPGSLLYGSNAMGGVIEVKPFSPGKDQMYTRLSTSFGSYKTGQHRFAHGADLGRGFYSFTAGFNHTQGDRPNSAYYSPDGSLGFGYELSPVWKVSLQGRYGYFHVEDPGPVSAPLDNSYARVGRGGFTVNIDNTAAGTWGYARVYSSWGHHIITDGFRSTDNTTGVRVHQFWAVRPELVAEGGADIISYGGRARNVMTGVDFDEHRETTAAGFTRLQYSPRRKLHLSAGIRYDHSSQHGGIAVPQFGVSYSFTDNYTLSMEVSRGFRNPTIRELYLFPAPNPLLKPEHMWNYQAILQMRLRSDLSVWMTGYYADLDNQIITTGRYPNLELQNGGRSLNRGWETKAQWKPWYRLQFDASYAYLRSTNLAPLVPRHKLNYSLNLNLTQFSVYFGGTTVGRRWTNASRNAEMDPYTLIRLKCTKPIGRNTHLFVTLDNLFNSEYEVVPGYPMPGTNAMAGLSFEF